MTEKMRAGLTYMAFLLLWLIVGSSVSILSPTDGKLGVLFGSLFSLAVILGPVYYVKFRNIKVKNPKPVFVEPSAWLVTPLSFATSGLLLFLYLIVLSIPPFNFILNQLGKDTFIGNFAMMILIFTSLFGPVTVFFVYTRMRYKRIVEYNSVEWKKVRAQPKAQVRVQVRSIQAAPKERAILAFVLSVISLVTFAFAPFAFVLAIVALATGIQRKRQGQSYATAAIVISVTAIVLSLLVMPIFIQSFMESYQ